tara:strand:- start:5983 stop:6195 length:213 start_codon:yes stop_codon:yes gene_type:complete
MEEKNKKKYQKLSELFISLSDDEKKDFVISHLLKKEYVDFMKMYSQALNSNNFPGYIELEEIERFLNDES